MPLLLRLKQYWSNRLFKWRRRSGEWIRLKNFQPTRAAFEHIRLGSFRRFEFEENTCSFPSFFLDCPYRQFLLRNLSRDVRKFCPERKAVPVLFFILSNSPAALKSISRSMIFLICQSMWPPNTKGVKCCYIIEETEWRLSTTLGSTHAEGLSLTQVLFSKGAWHGSSGWSFPKKN